MPSPFQQQPPPPVPPLKGSFPLDHDANCKREVLIYMLCLHDSNKQNSQCRHLARDYFECRMRNGLMEREDWSKLGLDDVDQSIK